MEFGLITNKFQLGKPGMLRVQNLRQEARTFLQFNRSYYFTPGPK